MLFLEAWHRARLYPATKVAPTVCCFTPAVQNGAITNTVVLAGPRRAQMGVSCAYCTGAHRAPTAGRHRGMLYRLGEGSEARSVRSAARIADADSRFARRAVQLPAHRSPAAKMARRGHPPRGPPARALGACTGAAEGPAAN